MRRLALGLGIGGAALAAVFILTVVPLVAAPVTSQPFSVHASTSDSTQPACATMDLTGVIEPTIARPVLDLFGLARVQATIVSPVVHIGGDSPCPPDTDVSESEVIVYTPDCGSPAEVDS